MCRLLESLTVPEAPWAGQVARVREWYAPHLERLYAEAQVRAGDLEQLEKISANFAGREDFSASWRSTRRARPATSPARRSSTRTTSCSPPCIRRRARNGTPSYVLNVSDGSFPSEFATGRAEQIEEERRLLYVAMTRAKTSLDLLAPVKYFVTQQSRVGDRHVYGARSRFLTPGVMACFEPLAWSDEAHYQRSPRARWKCRRRCSETEEHVVIAL